MRQIMEMRDGSATEELATPDAEIVAVARFWGDPNADAGRKWLAVRHRNGNVHLFASVCGGTEADPEKLEADLGRELGQALAKAHHLTR